MIEILLILSMGLNAFLLYRYIPIWIMYRKEVQIDKKIAAEIDSIRSNDVDLKDLKDLLPTAEELEDLLDDI